MPNQWVRVGEQADVDKGLEFFVRRGPPTIDLSWPLGKVYRVPEKSMGMFFAGPMPRAKLPIVPHANVELLGPDECAELDKLYGLKGTESDEG